MKKIKTITLITTLFLASHSAIAAKPVDHLSVQGLTRLGVISISSASTLSHLEDLLAEKAANQGASHYKIIAAGGNNLMYGSAVIYK